MNPQTFKIVALSTVTFALFYGSVTSAECVSCKERRAPREGVSQTSAAYPVEDFSLDTIKEALQKNNEEIKRSKGCCQEVLSDLEEVDHKIHKVKELDKAILHKVKDVAEDLCEDTMYLASLIDVVQETATTSVSCCDSVSTVIGTEADSLTVIECADIDTANLTVVQWLKAIYNVVNCLL